MKTMVLPPFILAIALANVSVGQQRHDGDNSDSIQGTETFEALVTFTATGDAPPCASGGAHIEAENEEGTVTAALGARFRGLPAGDYVLSAVRTSDGSSEVLAQLSLEAPSDDQGGDDQEGDQGEQGDWHWGGSGHGEGDGQLNAQWQWCQDGGQGDTNCAGTFQVHVEMQIPADLDVTDIAQLVLSDTNNTALLVGDVTGSTNSMCQYTASVRLAPGAAGTRVHGKASVHVMVHNGRHSRQVSITASGVPANATVNVQVNGKHLGVARSGPRGNLSFQRTGATGGKISTLSLIDAHGRLIGHAQF